MNLRKSVLLSTLLLVPLSVTASSSDNWEAFSDVGAYGLVGVALALPAYKDDWEGFKQAGYSVVTASGVSLLGKSLIDAERPDNSGNDSFPSSHTANAFAAATTLNLRYGWEVGFPAYGIATLVGVGRVQADKHYWKDVLAGALIGSLAGWVFTDSFDDSVQIVPWAGRHEAGLTVSINW
jgi:membrane-associated phospholipid phosphatase